MTEKEEAEKPKEEYKLYKGETVKVKDIKDFPVIIQRPTPTGKLPRVAILKSIQAGWSGSKYKYASLWDEGAHKDTTAELHVDDEVRILTGRRAQQAVEEYRAWGRTNLRIVRSPKTLGADPEIFVVNKKGEVIPAWKFLPSKDKPLGVQTDPYVRDKVVQTAYWDGFQAEFTTRAAGCLAYFTDDIHRGLKAIHEAAKAYDKHARLSIKSVLPVDPETLATADTKHVEFGCMPSRNVYDLTGRVGEGRTTPIRFAGGHIHFGLDKKANIIEGITGMDTILGVACTALFGEFDVPVRREYYGQPGEYRLPPHGVEYRTLSNAWLIHPVVTHMVYELARVAYDFGLINMGIVDTKEPVEIIQSSDPEHARHFMNANKDAFICVFKSVSPFYDTGPEMAYNAFYKGAHTFIAEPENFEKNWDFDYWVWHSDGALKNWRQAAPLIAKGGKL